MKSITKYIPLLGILLAAVGFTSCQDDFDNKIPAFEAPVAEHQANMSILDLKNLYWHSGDESDPNYLNYCDTIGFLPGTENEHIYIAGRVISNDQDGNVFKSLIIQDKTAAIAFSINQYDLYLQYRPGQEIVVDVTGMYIGKYRGLMQIGLPSKNDQQGYTETSFMPIEFFRMHSERNGFPEPSKIDTLEFNDFATFSSSANPEILKKYQSQLVRFNNVYFADANGTTQFSEYKSSGKDRNIVDINKATLPVRTSGYSTFWNNPLPKGNGDVVAILSYYGSSASNVTYQLVLNDFAGCMNFGNPTVPKGTSADNPLSIDEVIEKENSDVSGSGWVTGYIVGAVKPEVESEIKSNDDIEWTADVTLANTIVLAPAPEIKDIASCLVLPLPQGSVLRQYANLLDNPGNYKKQMWVTGSFNKYMNAWGLTSAGSPNDFRIDGVVVPGTSDPEAQGDGSEANPYGVQQIIAMNPSSTTEAVETGVWVQGYIVGYMPTGGSSTTLSGAVFTAADAANTNLVLAPSAYTTDPSQCIGIQLPSGDVRNKLNLQTNPGNLGAHVALKGDVMKYCGGPGLKTVSTYKFLSEVPDTPDTPDTPGEGSGDGTEASPWNVAKVMSLYNAGSTGQTGWMECYIVGSVPSQYFSDAVFGTENASATNILVAASASTTSADACIPVQLPTGDVRNALNLQAHPENLGKKVLLNGTIDKYFGVAGFKSVTEYKMDGSTTTPDTPDTPTTGLGTENAPINVTQAIAAYVEGQAQDAWVEGYIVGCCPKGTIASAIFTAEGAAATNMLIAASASETDASKCIPVQLPSGDIRAALNILDNPGNLGKKVKLHGSLEKYMTVAGLKTPTAYTLY